MIVRHPDPPPSLGPDVPAGLPGTAVIRRLHLPRGGVPLDLLAVPAETDDDLTAVEPIVRAWLTDDAQTAAVAERSAAVVVPLYGCLVAWTPGRAAIVGPTTRLDHLEAAVADFSAREADLRDAEQRAASLLDTVETDATEAFAIDESTPRRREALTVRYREAVSVGRRLALLAPAVHAPPIHPPTLASQLGERLRERTRQAERHELAVSRVELAERVTESCGQRAADAGIAARQMALEWAIVVLLVVQTALLTVDLLARRGTP
jgi:hypothetical protein